MSQWCNVSVDKANVSLDCILTGAGYPQPEMYWVDHSLRIQLHFGPACSDVIDTLWTYLDEIVDN